VEGEEEVSVICVKVVVKGKGRDQSADMKSRGPRTEPWRTPPEEV